MSTEEPRPKNKLAKAWQRLKNLKGGKRFGRCRLLTPHLPTKTDEISNQIEQGPRNQFLHGSIGKRKADVLEEPPADLSELVRRKRRLLSHMQCFSREQVKLQMEHTMYASFQQEKLLQGILSHMQLAGMAWI